MSKVELTKERINLDEEAPANREAEIEAARRVRLVVQAVVDTMRAVGVDMRTMQEIELLGSKTWLTIRNTDTGKDENRLGWVMRSPFGRFFVAEGHAPLFIADSSVETERVFPFVGSAG